VVHTNTEQMVALAINSPLTTIASDAYWQNGTGHPRTTGTYAKVLGYYVRETRSLSMMEAISKMTLMPAQRLEARVPMMRQKGRLAVGADADITIFDPATVMDRSTYREPSLPPGRDSARDRERHIGGYERSASRWCHAGQAGARTDPP